MIPKAVLFDCDGVLVDSEPASHRLLVRRLKDAGLDLEEDQISKMFLGGTIAGLTERARTMGADLSPNWIDETYEELFVILADVPEIPGARKLLGDLSAAGVPFAICSNGPMRKMEVTLGATGMWDMARNRIFSAHVHGPPKPAPDLYRMGAELCEAAPSNCVVVEDSRTGAKAARAAGIACLALALPDDIDGVRAEGAEVISSLEDVRARVLGS